MALSQLSPGVRPAPPRPGRGAGSTRAANSWLRGMLGLGDDRVIHLMRHGETEMNVHLGQCFPAYGERGFVDPLLHDTRLTPRGAAQARRAAASVAELAPAPEVVIVSPLTRALQTADAAFAAIDAPRVVQPLAAERLYLSSDVGRVRALLEQDFPHYDFGELPEAQAGRSAAWWHTADSWSEAQEDEEELVDLLAVTPEPEIRFLQRVERLRLWLESRAESSMALVSHWGVLQALTGVDFENCECRSVRLGQLRARPFLLRGQQEQRQPVQRSA